MLRVTARTCAGLGLCALAAAGLAACSSGPTSRAHGAIVHVTLRDFHIKVSRRHVDAGEVRLLVANKGPDTHELLIARTGAALPLRKDGLTIDEERLEPVIVAEAEAEPPDSAHVVRLRLRPGRYELFCNMAGHYLGGMRAVLVVT
jgi:uncharacterized cupredoxin-like copper-binding protein